MALPQTHPCPRCNRNLRASGVVDVDGHKANVFQCDECLVSFDFDGQTFTGALTFAVDEGGLLLDPETFEPLQLDDQDRDAGR